MALSGVPFAPPDRLTPLFSRNDAIAGAATYIPGTVLLHVVRYQCAFYGLHCALVSNCILHHKTQINVIMQMDANPITGKFALDIYPTTVDRFQHISESEFVQRPLSPELWCINEEGNLDWSPFAPTSPGLLRI